MTKPTAVKAKPSTSGGNGAGLFILCVLGLFAASRAYDRATLWWDTEGQATWTLWWDEWRPRLALAAVTVAALGVLWLVLRVRRSIRTKPMRKAKSRAEMLQPARSDGSIPAITVRTNPEGETTAMIVTFDLGETVSPAYQKQTAEIQGVDRWGMPANTEFRFSAGKFPRPQLILTKPQPDTRDRTERRLEEIATSALPDITAATITARDDSGEPSAVRFDHKASFRALTNDTACETLEKALVAALGWKPHTYRMAWDQQADVVVLERWTDPLATVTPALPVSMLTKVDLSAIPIGVRDDGEPCLLDMTEGNHLLIAGLTGSGKSSAVQSAFRAVAPLVGAGLLQLRGVCPKGGAELGKARPMFYDLAAGPVNSKGPAADFEVPDGSLLLAEHQRQLDLLVRAGTDCLMRAYRLGAQGIRKHTPSLAEPAVWVVIDELAMITAYIGDKKDRDMVSMAMAAVLTQGRAWNFHLIGLLQDPRMRTLEIRNLFPQRIGLRLDSKAEVAMVLGDTALAEGARCDLIDKHTKGVFYMCEDGGGHPSRNRAAFVTDPDIEDICKRFPAPAWTSPPSMGAADTLVEAVEAGVLDAGKVAQVGAALDELAVEIAKATPKKRAPRKRAAPKPEAGPLASEPVMADAVAVGDTLSLTDEKGKRFEGTVAQVSGDDPIRLAGPGWEREVEATDTLRRLIFA